MGALAPGNRQPQGIADPFVPDAKDTGAAPAVAIDPIIAPAPLLRPAAIVSTGAASNPLAAPPVPAPAPSPSPLPLIAPGFWIPAWKKNAKPFLSPQAFPGSNLSTLDLKSINMRTLMSMMPSTNYSQSHT